MPERIAKTDPFKQITEYIGSGPMKFAKGEWVPGAKAVFEKFADYAPRQEKASWLAGGKKMLVDRIEWMVMPDPATAAAALQNGEVDWWESPIPDLVPSLKKNRNIEVDIADPLGNIGSFRMNHLHPPFNNVKVRRAVLMALSQEDYMRAVVGDDTSLWKPLPGFFTPGTPLYTEEGGEILKGKRDIARAKKLLAESGYSGQPVTCVVAQDQPITKAMGDVTADLLKQIGMNVDFVATDWGTVGPRRAQKTPPGQGGWGMFHTWHAGADCINPAAYIAIRANGDKAWFGWPNSELVEKEVLAWFAAKNLDEEKAAVKRLNKAALDDVVYAPTGFFLSYRRGARTSPASSRGRCRSSGAWRSPHDGAVNRMLSYIVRRILATIPVMGIVALFVFSLLYIAPGDPAAVIAGDQASPADVERSARASASTGRFWSSSGPGSGTSCMAISAPRSSPTCRCPR